MTAELNVAQFGQRVPIPPSLHQRLAELTAGVSPERVEGVRQRAIAVWVVARYLNRFGYDCRIDNSSAWNLYLQVLSDFAELEIFEDQCFLGTVECLLLPPDVESLEIPEHLVMGDRIAYVAVEVNPQQTWGAIVGFTPALETEFPELSFERDELFSADRLLDLLEMAEPLAENAVFSELESYWEKQQASWSEQRRQAIVAKLERVLLVKDIESLQLASAAQELEALIHEDTGGTVDRELAFREEDDRESGDRAELYSILRRIFHSVREALE
ncbi:DUF1822 family protein [Phormidium sp. CCY1219]|jgi:hypothetical protein|uniref:DUF1822 family protein n=1 Tax=Phormidium sp. CCY1219 TaxID=2886104 RepID=UPI002D1F3ED8|nr:DUF1822 family protein [Phormidium sp. CCY1219]MEB3828594.1 DUF1822 family protein [Phormidium sp. CCY1219]